MKGGNPYTTRECSEEAWLLITSPHFVSWCGVSCLCIHWALEPWPRMWAKWRPRRLAVVFLLSFTVKYRRPRIKPTRHDHHTVATSAAVILEPWCPTSALALCKPLSAIQIRLLPLSSHGLCSVWVYIPISSSCEYIRCIRLGPKHDCILSCKALASIIESEVVWVWTSY